MPQPAPAPTPREIAAGVRRSAAHQVAENRLAELRRQRDALQSAAREAFGREGMPQHIDTVDDGPDGVALQREAAALADAISDARHKLAPLRDAHATAVGSALSEMRRTAARRAVAAIADLAEAVHQLNAAADEIRRASGDAPSIVMPPLEELGRSVTNLAAE